MSIKMLIFDYKKSEHLFFKKHKLEDFDIEFYEESLNDLTVHHLSDDIRKETTIISVFITSYINKKVLDMFPNLQIISTRSTGYDHIEIDSSRERNIKVLNVENYGEHAVVQFTIGLIIALLRKLLISDADMKAFNFDYNNYVGRELNVLTLGVMGTGAIGSGIIKIAHAFEMKILAYDTNHKKNLEEIYNVKYTDKESLLKESDIVTLHMPSTSETYHMISREELAIMKSTAYLINTARGELVNTEALYNAIENGNIAGAALDVVECETLGFSVNDLIYKIKNTGKNCISDVLLTRRMVQLPNVIVTPHVAYSTQDSINRILEVTFNSISDCLKGGHKNQVN